jgi:hypothetical protein
LALEAHLEFGHLLDANFSPTDLDALFAKNEIDPTAFVALPAKERGLHIAKLIAARANLQRVIVELLTDASRKRSNAVRILEEVEAIKDRILNPASHAGITPVYTKEAEDAIKVIQALDPALAAALATL